MNKLILISLLIPIIVSCTNYFEEYNCRITQLIDHQTRQPVEINSLSVMEFSVKPDTRTNIYLAGDIIGGPMGSLDITTGKRMPPFIVISKLDYTFDGMYVFYKKGELASGFCKK